MTGNETGPFGEDRKVEQTHPLLLLHDRAPLGAARAPSPAARAPAQAHVFARQAPAPIIRAPPEFRAPLG